jgi:LacI family transcriptional regulator
VTETAPNKRSSARRRKILLAMGVPEKEREAGVVRYAWEAGWILDTFLHYYHAVGEDQDYLITADYDGVLAGCERQAAWLPPLLRKFTVPVVDMWADYLDEPFPRVILDNVGLGRAATEHLLSRGFRNLLFFGHAVEARSAILRAEGFRDAVESAGAHGDVLTWDPRLGPKGRQARAAWLADWLSRAKLPLGVVGSKDQTACEVLEAADLAGLEVPRQLAVIGVDNDPAITQLAALVPLSSVDSALECAGYEAAKLLDQLIDGATPPAQPILVPPGPVFARRSTDALAVRNPDIAAAIQFIHDHFQEPISRDDVVEHTGMSLRYLQDRIVEETGRTISEMITWERLEHAKRLLVSTRMKIHLIAQRCGFGTNVQLCRVFRRLIGTSPDQYRDQYTSSAPNPIPAAKE